MSSHHIVRDDQEPALIIANGASCSEELMGQLLEWSPLVIVLDSAIERVLELDIKVDVLLGDFDRGFKPEYYLDKQYPLEIVYAPNQDKTDLEKAFDNVDWGRLFEIMKGAGVKYRERKVIYILYKNQTAVIRVEGHEKEAVVGKGVRQGCSLSPMLFNLYIEQAVKNSRRN